MNSRDQHEVSLGVLDIGGTGIYSLTELDSTASTSEVYQCSLYGLLRVKHSS
jgi:hypothetical protein